MRILAGQDEHIAAWAGQELGIVFQEPYTAFGFIERDKVKGAVIFNDYYRGGNVEITYVGAHSFRKQQVSFMCKFAFQELGCSRVTARTRRGNALMRKLLPRFGFQYECTQKRFYGPTQEDDGISFVLWPNAAAKWLRVS